MLEAKMLEENHLESQNLNLKEASLKEVENNMELLSKVRQEIGKVIFGQEEIVEQSLITILSGGHALFVGVPGLAKTLLVKTLGKILGLEAKRVQFTPDIMPSDILGAEILEEEASGKHVFRFLKGPIFSQLLMADEINRASPRAQSALLQAMQEGFVTIAGEKYDLPSPFHVLATQNPIEQEGAYPLPEAQLDRFLMQIDINYPDLETERRIITQTTSNAEKNVEISSIITDNELISLQKYIRTMPVGTRIVEAILKLVRTARPDSGDKNADKLSWGAGPRAGQALMLATRARALLQGRLSPSLEDVISLAEPVLKHRIALNFAARAEGENVPDFIKKLTKSILH